jgi:predicted DNA-binding transcriptional regulator AlpA
VETVPRLAGLAEVATLRGVSRKRAWQITQHPDFPEPVQVLAMGPVWLESDVQQFIDTPRKSGRKAKMMLVDADPSTVDVVNKYGGYTGTDQALVSMDGEHAIGWVEPGSPSAST